MRRQLIILAVSLGLAGAGTALAHHSFAAEFDGNKPIRLEGTLSKVEWMNPHSYFYVDVKDDKGTAVTWGLRRRQSRCPFTPRIQEGRRQTWGQPGSRRVCRQRRRSPDERPQNLFEWEADFRRQRRGRPVAILVAIMAIVTVRY